VKIKHSKFGAARANKKLIAGAAALALVGGIAPTLINGTYALSEDFDESVYYTTVGPFYYTATPDLRSQYENTEGITIEIADTRVADWYYGYSGRQDAKLKEVELKKTAIVKEGTRSGVKAVSEFYPLDIDDCDYEYACIQGNKVGETEIIIRQNGSIVDRYTLKSVKLSPKAHRMLPSGRAVSETGSLEGEEDDVLRLRNVLKYDEESDTRVSITGDRSFKITSSKEVYPWSGAELVWTIGYEQVGGGTSIEFVPISAYDNVYGLEENEDILANSTATIFEALQEDEDFFVRAIINGQSVYNYETSDGSVINWYSQRPQGGGAVELMGVEEKAPIRRGEYVVELTAEDADLKTATENALTAKLPGKATNVTFKSIEANVYSLHYQNGGGDVALSALRGALDEAEKDKIADFNKLGKAVTISFDVSDAEPAKSGYTRTWYVVREADGKTEAVSDVTYDTKNNRITFATDTFGAYAYAYVDEFVPVVPDTGIAPQKVAMVATATFAPLAVLTLGAFIARSRKKAANKLAKKHSHFE